MMELSTSTRYTVNFTNIYCAEEVLDQSKPTRLSPNLIVRVQERLLIPELPSTASLRRKTLTETFLTHVDAMLSQVDSVRHILCFTKWLETTLRNKFGVDEKSSYFASD